jgi:predicted SprT family Zn-dependent metalloprotease
LDKGVAMAERSKTKGAVKPKNLPKAKAIPRTTNQGKSEAASVGVTFKCRLCEKQRPISEMKIIKRFRPVIFVCQECEKTLL